MFIISKKYDLNKQAKLHMETVSSRLLGTGFSISPVSYTTWMTKVSKLKEEVLKVGSTGKRYSI